MVDYVKYNNPSSFKLYKFGKYSFSSIEIKHLSIALVLISIAIMVLRRDEVLRIGVIPFVSAYLLTIGLGFLLHELGHKLVAQHYGFVSEFRADFQMMYLAILMAWFGFLFLAPGAVMIFGRLSIRQNGIVSVAGPVVNLVLAIIFILIGKIFNPIGYIGYVVVLGIWINAFLGVFNMLPFWVLDGKKVLAWKKLVYFFVMGLLLLILIGSFKGVFF